MDVSAGGQFREQASRIYLRFNVSWGESASQVASVSTLGKMNMAMCPAFVEQYLSAEVSHRQNSFEEGSWAQN